MSDLEAQSTKTSVAYSWNFQLFTVLLLMLFAMSALTVYVAIQNSQNTQKIKDLQDLYMDDSIEEDGDEVIMTKHTIRAARSLDGSGEVCESTFYPNLNVTPSAHLVGSDSMNPRDNTNLGFLDAWRCNLTNAAHVIGGMKTTSAGELIVPVSGVYYIYLQLRVEVKVFTDNGKTRKLSHQIKVRRIRWNPVMERFESLNYDNNYTYETTNYYGGLHYLRKGDAIAVSMPNPCRSDICNVTVIRRDHPKRSSFFGAFLVTPATNEMMQRREH